MSAVHDLDDIGPDETMDLDGGRRIDLSQVVVSLAVPLRPGDAGRLERLAAERGEPPEELASRLLSDALRAKA